MSISDNPILTEDQKSLLARFRNSPLCRSVYLTGGTALSAFYLHHRLSEDLDFFSPSDVAIEEVLAFVRSLPSITEAQYERKYDRKIFLLRYSESRIMKVEFTTYPFTRLETGPVIDGIEIDSLKDILANKIIALTDRQDPKDYVDLYWALKENPDFNLEQLIGRAEHKFGIKGVQDILRGKFLGAIPALGILKMREELNQEEMARFFTRRARDWIRRSTEGKP